MNDPARIPPLPIDPRRLPHDHSERLARARLSLEGLSVGDAFGECFFGNPHLVERRVEQRQEPPSPWYYTDDTAMGVSIYRCLEEHREIQGDRLAELFAEEYARDPRRGYGGTAHSILRAIGAGVPWQRAAGEAFSGMGSMGNGGAMRVGPLGAYFADDIDELARQARLSAEVTHAHPEGHAGTLTAAAWCLLTSGSFEETVLKAVNLGGDTDTTGCVAGGLAGAYYGAKSIPAEWKQALVRHDDLEALFAGFLSCLPACTPTA